MSELLLMVPSRGRPENIRRLVYSLSDTTDQGLVDLVVGVDSDDPMLPVYEFDWETTDWPYRLQIGRDLRQVASWLNYLANIYCQDYKYLGTVGDDNIFRTLDWDREVIDSLSRQEASVHGLGFCWGTDLLPGRPPGSLATHIFMTSNVIERLLYMCPIGLRHMFVDNVWTEWAKGTSYEYLPQIIIEHLHPSAGKAEHDKSYAESDACVREDQQFYNHYTKHVNALSCLSGDLERLRALRRDHE